MEVLNLYKPFLRHIFRLQNSSFGSYFITWLFSKNYITTYLAARDNQVVEDPGQHSSHGKSCPHPVGAVVSFNLWS